MPAQRFLHRLVDHAHAAAADLPQDAVVAHLLRRPAARGLCRRPGERAGGVPGAGLEVAHDGDRLQQLTQLLGQLGVPGLVFRDRRILAALLPVEELFDQRLDEVMLPDGIGHGGPLYDRQTSMAVVKESRDALEDLTQAPQRADVPVAGCGGVEPALEAVVQA